MIIVGAGLIAVVVGVSVTQRADETTMYWLGFGGALVVIGLNLRRR